MSFLYVTFPKLITTPFKMHKMHNMHLLRFQVRISKENGHLSCPIIRQLIEVCSNLLSTFGVKKCFPSKAWTFFRKSCKRISSKELCNLFPSNKQNRLCSTLCVFTKNFLQKKIKFAIIKPNDFYFWFIAFTCGCVTRINWRNFITRLMKFQTSIAYVKK